MVEIDADREEPCPFRCPHDWEQTQRFFKRIGPEATEIVRIYKRYRCKICNCVFDEMEE